MRQLRNFRVDMCYHLMSRVAHRAFYFSPEERARFVERMWRVAGFAGLTVLAYCVMSNHFHILVYVPDPAELSDDELIRRVRLLYWGDRLAEIEKEWALLADSPSALKEFRRKYIRRMCNVSEFMKTLKQDVTMSINNRNGHVETMWGSRFRAVRINPRDKEALASVAAYIDRNPVKAKLVSWPDAYEWCGFAAADKGDKRCVGAYAGIYSYDAPFDWKEIRETHGQMVARKLRELEKEPADGPSELDLFVSGEKRGDFLPAGLKDVAESRKAFLPKLVERGSNQVALDLLEELREGPLGPAQLRLHLGIKSIGFFSSYYLTPLESSGFIEIANGCSRQSPMKTFRLTEKGHHIINRVRPY